MIELLFWHEPRVPSPAQAEARYQQVLDDERPVRLGELDQRLQDFVRDARSRAPQAEILELGRAGGEPLYSRHGIAVLFPEEVLKDVYPKLTAAADEPRLHLYDRSDGSVTGIDSDPDVQLD
ncbi:hypothetical protein [Glycomyces terrestris]|uniref:Uncharacterized protein n=1 Tax=Glycomyces terrestris TaxID=2493553 RepID=A0A426UY54_9ACTN|nr:hypothetical protein [Glycomyces terrestris]RRR99502.1 hypothetical protein EIW28_12415 [Glycomyces terrestris]